MLMIPETDISICKGPITRNGYELKQQHAIGQKDPSVYCTE
uniref:Uncharacterized protein n=1 Tax=Rhizophora mucronata TaxID=61149 RepID=A0A2P2JCS5_RHIMU